MNVKQSQEKKYVLNKHQHHQHKKQLKNVKLNDFERQIRKRVDVVQNEKSMIQRLSDDKARHR